MPRMIDLIRESAVPSQMLRSAALGALSLPPAEIIEILVFLAKNPIVGKEARLTLAGWDEAASAAVAADPNTPREVLAYLAAPQNRRLSLVPALLENPAVEEGALLVMAQTDSREIVSMMLASARVRHSGNLLQELLVNPHLSDEELDQTRQWSEALRTEADAEAALSEATGRTTYEIEHAAEIAAEAGRPFELVDVTEDEKAEATAAMAAPVAAPEPQKLSMLQKIARMAVGERVQTAMKGSRDERFVLIRDGSHVVSNAVIESPKVSEQEIESFAAMKNVHESVLRSIAAKRKFMKNYAVVRALVNNPRCPLDISLALIKNMLVHDLKNLSMNKNVPDTIRKVALKLYRDKISGGNKD